jgi:serine/threonine-protein kinase HipA
MALTEAVWLREDPPAEAVAFWTAAYPALTTLPRCQEMAGQAGLEVVDTFPLPAAAWRAYYAPLVDRCRTLAPHADPALRQAIDETLAEVEVFERYGESYGYAFFVLRVPPAPAKSRE